MNETTAQVIQFPWAAVITGVAGLLGALGGSFLTNKFAEKRWDKQVQLEFEKEKKKQLREKGEQVFHCLTKWNKQLYFFYVARMGFLQGNITSEKLQEVIKEKTNADTHGEVYVLVNLYFRDFVDDVESLFTKIEECNAAFGLVESKKLSQADALNKMVPKVEELEEMMENLIKKFSNHISLDL